jgi:hypothetical protein
LRARNLAPAALLCAGTLALAAGCGGDSLQTAATTTSATSTTPTTTSSSADTAVVQGSKGDFSPEAIYRKVSPGVVTILSLFGSSGDSVLGGAQGGQGSGFVISKEGEIVTNAHVVTSGGEAAGGGRSRRPRRSSSSSPTTTAFRPTSSASTPTRTWR